MRVNLIAGGLVWVFKDLVDRLTQLVKTDIIVTDHPLQHADVFHFWRPQLAANVPDLSQAVLTCHGLGYWQEGEPIYNAGVMQAFARARAVVTLNRADAAAIGEHANIIPHAVDPEVFTLRPPHNPREKLVIGRVGRPYERGPDDPDTGVACKGNATLRQIMRGLVPERDAIKWLFVGEGWGEFANEARDLGFEAEYRMRSAIGYPEGYVQAYHEMDVFLVTSRSEGGPASLPEAMACGVRPLCTPVGMCADLLPPKYDVPGVGGWCSSYGDLYPVNNAGRAMRFIRHYMTPYKRERWDLTWIHRQRVEPWTWPKWAQAHLDVYSAVANSR